MRDSQKKKQKINKSAQIRGQSEAVHFNNIEKRFPARIHRFHILPGYCSIDRAGIFPQLILNQTSGSPRPCGYLSRLGCCQKELESHA